MAAAAKTDDILDVAIVGGGVSGIYSGWRLLTSPPQGGVPRKVALYECSPRLGGRLLSVTPPDIPNARVELGGMRYMEKHTRVMRLVKYLGLKPDDFPVGQPQNIAYLRGKMLRQQDLCDASLIPYNLASNERDPDTLANVTAEAARRVACIMLHKDVALDEVDWQKLAKARRYQGQALSDLLMQYVIQRSISEEAFEFAEDTGGYDSILHTWNAADGLPWILADFGPSVKYFRLGEGFETLPLTLAKQFHQAGGEINCGHRLKSFDIVCLPDRTVGIEMQLDAGGSARRVLARQLILAMPRRALELLDQTGPVLAPTNKKVRALIRSVTPIPLFKLAICYRCPWWETLPPVAVTRNSKTQLKKIKQGQSITDLPVRQCYYWAVDKQTRHAVVLIYDDGSDLDYWAEFRKRQHREPFALPDGAGDTFAPPSWNKFKAPPLMVEEAHRQLLIMHGVTGRADIPQPYDSAYRDWGEDPFGGGANFWHLHVKSDEVFHDILQPKPPIPVYICGEAYSHDQGWVEGSLATADEMLERYFGLKARHGWRHRRSSPNAE
jgi:hypothetical protein